MCLDTCIVMMIYISAADVNHKIQENTDSISSYLKPEKMTWVQIYEAAAPLLSPQHFFVFFIMCCGVTLSPAHISTLHNQSKYSKKPALQIYFVNSLLLLHHYKNYAINVCSLTNWL